MKQLLLSLAIVAASCSSNSSDGRQATVLGWYSHVSGTWTTAGSPDNHELPNLNGVRIEVDRLGYGNEPVGSRPRTIICLNPVASGPENSSC